MHLGALRAAAPVLLPTAATKLPTTLLALRGGVYAAHDVATLQTAVVSAILYLGTMMSALSGCISAGAKQMDLLGCIIVSCVTAIGGGTLRDVVLSRKPFWMIYPNHLHLCIWFSALVFCLWPYVVGGGFKDTHLAFLWSDALGMAASTVIGAHIGLDATGLPVVGVMCGLVTATFGGIGRDVLCLEPPRALYAERSMYATPALLGAGCYVLLTMLREHLRGTFEVPEWLVASVPFFLALFTRAAAWTYRLALPVWARKSPAFGLFQFGDHANEPRFKLELSPAPHGKS